MSRVRARRRAEPRQGRGASGRRAIPAPWQHGHEEGTARVGLWVGLTAWTMVVIPLVASVFRLRVEGGEAMFTLAPAFAACSAPAVLALAVLGLANHALRRGRGFRAGRGLTPAGWLGVFALSMLAFLGLKAWLIARAVAAGLHPTESHFASLWFGIACLQLGAVLAGACGVAWHLLRARRSIVPVYGAALNLWSTWFHATSALSVVTFVIARAP